ncbi:MAG TPA: COX aromatic rich motif-containing protein [Candidatus Saccharimonadales bacterium]|nr:COX aromatic rich motif-containing protein [Candidatus Saccharimonadales bacterium]
MKRISKPLGIVLLFLILLAIFILLARNGNLQLLNPQGYIAQMQSEILFGALILAVCIGIPTVIATYFLAFHYRKGSKNAAYSPNWTGGKLLVIVWWTLPTLLIIIFSVITWKTTHLLDPYRPLASQQKPITIQVVALDWKWLFIYPSEKIATVNFIEFPVNTPVNFQLTADGPMNSFWIPSLGSQIYAMSGMVTQLHLSASTIGEFPGSATEINGKGFSGMKFIAKSSSKKDFDIWVQSVQKSGKPLTLSSYDVLSSPSMYNKVVYYRYIDTKLYAEIVARFMTPTGSISMPHMY